MGCSFIEECKKNKNNVSTAHQTRTKFGSRSFRIGHENVRAAPPLGGLMMTSYPVLLQAGYDVDNVQKERKEEQLQEVYVSRMRRPLALDSN